MPAESGTDTLTLEPPTPVSTMAPASERSARRSRWNVAPATLALLGAILSATQPPLPVLPAIIVLAAWCLVPGEALARVVPAPRPSTARLVFAVSTGVLLAGVISLLMISTGAWFPRAGVTVVLVASAAVVLARPLPAVQAKVVQRRFSTLLAEIRPVPFAVFAASAIAWGTALVTTNTNDLGEWGLLPALPVQWYLALAAVVAVVIAEFFRARPSGVVLGVGLLLLIGILYGTPNLVEAAPRLPWVYKHVAVTSLFEAVGHLDPAIDLYNRWPGFFSTSAFLGQATGALDPIAYIRFAEPVTAVVDATLILLIARRLSGRRPAAAWTAAVIFTLGNWVGQNYYSPQGFAFALYLLVALLVLSALRGEPRPGVRRLEERIARRFTVTRSLSNIVDPTPALDRRVAIAGVLIAFACIVASHQLTPYLALLALLPLFVIGYLRPRWLGLALLALTLLYLLPNFGYIQSKYGLFSGFDFYGNASYTPPGLGKYSGAAVWQGRGVDLLSAVVVALGLTGIVRRFRSGDVRTATVVLWLAVAPTLSLAVQTYGGEGRFRALLFALPWFSIGAAWLFWDGGFGRRARAGLLVTVTACAALLAAVFMQPEADVRIGPDHLVAGEWIDAHTRPHDQFVGISGQYPLILGSHYPVLVGAVTELQYLAYYLQEPSALPTGPEIQAFADQLNPKGRTFLVFSSDDQGGSARSAFLERRATSVESELLVTPGVEKVYSEGSVRVYQVAGTTAP